MFRLGILIAALFAPVFAPQASAAGLCSAVRGIVDALPAARSAAWIVSPLQGAASCDQSQALGGARAYHCRWDYPYRAPAATKAFEATDQSMQTCFGDQPDVRVDQQVNHPDTYLLKEYLQQTVTIRVSLKDKAQTGATHLFLWVVETEPR